MTNTSTDALAGLLFGHERKLVNFKLLRGDDPVVEEQDLRDEAHSALLQVRLGTCESHRDFPEDKEAKRVGVANLQAQLTN
ncbi:MULTISPECIES: hypothetical protein [unclassified Erythrobacter]|uniref:hypothetical protein n=1 Tax=unclassified Erythrobacter TaxID=2633097 RepID=UPI0007B93765|nr:MULTISPECIES: hypothetical protein [unclassified Erythrobacter]KZY95084.1 hypothetical protein A3745_08150 [Erythrobacter sp. HI0074]KZZ09135.1 hypothetical protein A3748_09190 [Erythrobacter sp. HI0077]MAQ30920.1 hypothetical protein [Erythrobacter sp.]